MAETKTLELGQELFRYMRGGGVHNFIVVNIPIVEHGGVQQYHIEDQMCTHGWKCIVSVIADNNGSFTVLGMVNDIEEDSQRYWHTGAQPCFLTIEEAKEAADCDYILSLTEIIDFKDSAIEDKNKRLLAVEKKIEKVMQEKIKAEESLKKAVREKEEILFKIKDLEENLKPKGDLK